jgi:hypothetical protein
MRNVLAATVLLASLVVSPAVAQDAPTIRIEVGAEVRLGGSNPICDDPSVAWISADGAGVLHAVKVGTTTCAVGLGNRRVYRVVVVEALAPGGGTPAPKKDPGAR